MAGEQGEQQVAGGSLEGDEPYQGAPGRTRTETVHAWMPDGKVRALPVYVGVDAVADPALAALARAGTLHHVADGVDLAIPFTYHDAAARLFVLVVPEGLRHRALALRAEQLTLVASDPRHAVPEYVREAEVVIGVAGLLARIAAGRPGPKFHGVDNDTLDDVRARALVARERELERRERLVEARELALRSSALMTVLADDGLDDGDVEEIAEDDDGALAYDDALGDLDDGDDAEDADDQVEEIEDIEEDLVAPDDELDGGNAGPLVEAVVLDHALPLVPGEDEPVVPPGSFVDDRAMQLCLSAAQGSAWLFVRDTPMALPEGSDMELLLQLDPHAEVPVVLVTLVFDADGAPVVRRGVVDVFDPAQRESLDLLGQQFAVELVSYAPDGSLSHWATLHTPREANVRAALALLEARGVPDRGSWLEARARLLSAPPPWRDLTHPFQPELEPGVPLTATEAAVLLDELAEWLAPERRERLRLGLCVPDSVVDSHSRASLAYALDWGLSLSGPLAARALELGIEKDEPALLLRRIEGLCRASLEPDHGGLEESVLRALWSGALEQAARLGVSLPDKAHDLAKQYAGERALVHADALSDPHDAALEPARQRARAEPPDQAALEQLAAQGGHRDVLEACRTTGALTPENAAQVFVRVARRGDPVAVDALLSLLTPSEPLRVRAGAALALASRHAVNAIEELARRVGTEAHPEWQLFAAALGRYGGGSFRAIARALADYKVQPDRAAVVLSHLALHGARAQVRAKARARDPEEAHLADWALSLASQLKDGKKPAWGLEQQESLTVFCEAFDRGQRDAV